MSYLKKGIVIISWSGVMGIGEFNSQLSFGHISSTEVSGNRQVLASWGGLFSSEWHGLQSYFLFPGETGQDYGLLE